VLAGEGDISNFSSNRRLWDPLDEMRFNDCQDIIERPTLDVRRTFGEKHYRDSLDEHGNVNYLRLYNNLDVSERQAFERLYDGFNQHRQRLIELTGFQFKIRELEGSEMHGRSKSKAAESAWSWSDALERCFKDGRVLTDDKILRRYKSIIEKVGTSRLGTIIAIEMIGSTLRAQEREQLSVCRVSTLAHAIAVAVEDVYLGVLATERQQDKDSLDLSRASFKAGYTQKQDNKRWSSHDRIALGSSLIAIALDVCKIEIPHPETGESVVRPAFRHSYKIVNKRYVGVILAEDYLLKYLAQDAPLFTIGSSKKLPMLVKPRPWTSFDEGGHLYFSLPLLSSTAFQAPEQEAYIKEAVRSGRMDDVLEALDRLASCPWAINKRILDVVESLWSKGEGILGIPERPPNYSYVAEKALKKREKARLKEKRNERAVFNTTLHVAKSFAKHGDRFYYPYQIDFRGRTYPATSTGLLHMNQDTVRALLQFWYGKKIGKRGLRWLKIQVANMYGCDKVSNDERVQFTESHMEEIKESARDPINASWWKSADNPFQTLAACFEAAEAMSMENPEEYESRIPVNQDGSCNGLQHYAALGGDVEGAQQVNMVAGSERPQDVYEQVSKIVKELTLKEAEDGVEIASELKDVITRKVVKQPVMTSVYGVTKYGAVDQVCAQLENIQSLDPKKRMKHAAYIVNKIIIARERLFSGATKLQHWLEECTERICRSFRWDVNRTHPDTYITSMIWTTPLGLPVVQPYRHARLVHVATKLQHVALINPYEVSPIDTFRQKNGIAPNFIHSLDSTHLFMTVIRAPRSMTFAAVHDSYWTHACDVDKLSQVLRQSFVQLYHTRDVIQDLYQELQIRYNMNLQQVELSSESQPAYNEICAYRYEQQRKKRNANQKQPKLNSKVYLSREMEIEYERRVDKTIATPSTILEKAAQRDYIPQIYFRGDRYDARLQDEEQEKKEDKPTPPTNPIKILVPIIIPKPPKRGDYSVEEVLENDYFFS
jgi:DNA-directed RNA polymerase